MKFCVIVICSFVFPATKMMTVIGSSTKASKANCSKSSKSKSGKSDSNNGCNTESLFFQHAVPDETAGENVFEASSIDQLPTLFLPDLGGGTAAPTIGTSIAPTAGGGTLAGTTLPPGTIAPTAAITLPGTTTLPPGTIAPTTAITLPDTTAGSTLSPIIGTLVEMSMSMPDLGGNAALTIGGMSMSLGDDAALEEAEQVVSNNDFEPLMMSMSMPAIDDEILPSSSVTVLSDTPIPDLVGGTAAPTNGEISMSMSLGVALEEAEQVVSNNDFEPLMMSMSMPAIDDEILPSSSVTVLSDTPMPDLGGGTVALTNGEMSMSMPDVGGTAAITIGDDVDAQKVVSNNDFEPLIMSMSLSMPSVEELTRERIYSDIDTTIEDEDEDENGEGFIENIKNATDTSTEFLQNVTNKVLDLFNGTETDNEEGVEDENMTSSAGTVAADYRVCRQITAAVASLIVMVVVL
jgi:hypothetical protein